jgi:hypothetical protein
MQVDLVVTRDGTKVVVCTTAGQIIDLDRAYLIPGFWFKVSEDNGRLIAILVHSTVGHVVYQLDITEHKTHQLAPYGHTQRTARQPMPVPTRLPTEESIPEPVWVPAERVSPAKRAQPRRRSGRRPASQTAAARVQRSAEPVHSPEPALTPDHERIKRSVRLLGELQGNGIACIIEPIGSAMRNVRRPWPKHQQHLSDGQWRRIGKQAARDSNMTSADATFIVFVSRSDGAIQELTFWIGIECNIDVLITALEDLIDGL